MSDHIDVWLDLYLDNELASSQIQQVEKHLAGCQRCQVLLEQRRLLSTLLHEVPPAGGLKPQERFVAELHLRIHSQQASIRAQKWLQWGWQLAPIGLLLTCAFLYTVSILSNLLLILPDAGQIVQQQIFPLASTLRLPGLAEIDMAGSQVDGLGLLLGSFNILDWNWLTNLFALAAIGLLYLGWLASWWARARQATQSPAEHIHV